MATQSITGRAAELLNVPVPNFANNPITDLASNILTAKSLRFEQRKNPKGLKIEILPPQISTTSVPSKPPQPDKQFQANKLHQAEPPDSTATELRPQDSTEICASRHSDDKLPEDKMTDPAATARRFPDSTEIHAPHKGLARSHRMYFVIHPNRTIAIVSPKTAC